MSEQSNNTTTLSSYYDHFTNWHTVPLNGELKRLENGKKTLPIFARNWREIHSSNKNELDLPLGGVITGKVSGITALDCDNAKTFDLFRSLDPEYEFYFTSIGKGEDCGTFIYTYEPDLLDLRVHGNTLSLDVLNDKGFVYLPTIANQTKGYPYYEKNGTHPKLKAMPQAIKTIILAMVDLKKSAPTEVKERESFVSHLRCEGIVSSTVKTKEYNPTFFSLLTPSKFQDHNYTRAKGRHPNTIPDGEGSNYLYAIATKLASDPSISTGLFVDAMQYINGLWDEPMPYDRLNKTVIQPHITNQTGFWTYDPDWKQHISTFTSLSNDLIEVFVDADKGLYYIINHSKGIIHSMSENAKSLEQLRKYLGASAVKDILINAPRISVVFNPNKPFGHFEGTKFNTFESTQALAILRDPSIWDKDYEEPVEFIKYMEHFVPDEFTRQYLIRFLLTKLTTFAYTPVSPYFIGVQGSGKDTLMGILRDIVGLERLVTIGGAEFIDKWNNFMSGTIFVQISEMSKSISKSQRPIALSRFKLYTGSSRISIETKGVNPKQEEHFTTLILTDNDDPLDLEAGDRRAFYIHTPNTFNSNPYIEEKYDGDSSAYYEKVTSDVLNICYYIATHYTPLDTRHYTSPPLTDTKHIAIEHNLPYAQRIVYMLRVGRFEQLAQFLFRKGSISVDKLFNELHKGIGIWEHNIVQCYKEIKPDGNEVIIIDALRSSDMSRGYTTFNKIPNCYYYDLPSVTNFKYQPYYDIKALDNSVILADEVNID